MYSIGPNNQIPDTSFKFTVLMSLIPFGVILPLIIWNRNKANYSSINTVGKMILNFQLTMFILIILMQGLGELVSELPQGVVSDNLILFSAIGIFMFLLGLFNLSLIIVNTIRCKKLLIPWYQPAIPFFKADAKPMGELISISN